MLFKLLTWQAGRQNEGYQKFPIIVSKRFLFDFYILKFDKGASVGKHRDPAKPGHSHHRLNIILKRAMTDRMYILGPIKRWWRFELFRPDLHFHGLEPTRGSMYMLSIGWLRKSDEAQSR